MWHCSACSIIGVCLILRQEVKISICNNELEFVEWWHEARNSYSMRAVELLRAEL